MTELKGSLEGLKLGKSLFNQVHGIILEGDSADAVLKLQQILGGLATGSIDSLIAKLLLETPRVEIIQIDRTANGAADFIANLACEDDFCWVRGMPLPKAFDEILSFDVSAM